MHRKLMVAIALMTASMALPQTWAGPITGPFFDYQGGVIVSNETGKIIDIDIKTGFDKKTKRYTDRLMITVDLDKGIDVTWWTGRLLNLAGVAYVEEPDDPAGYVRITTIYGEEQTPPGPTPLMTGFPAAGWDGQSVFSDETFIGNSGTGYLGTPLPFLTVADLPTQFPGFDLSVFSGADPTSRLFAFETFMPLSDVAVVPEPSALAAMALGLGLLVLVKRGHR